MRLKSKKKNKTQTSGCFFFFKFISIVFIDIFFIDHNEVGLEALIVLKGCKKIVLVRYKKTRSVTATETMFFMYFYPSQNGGVGVGE